jgi:hypothetical protein
MTPAGLALAIYGLVAVFLLLRLCRQIWHTRLLKAEAIYILNSEMEKTASMMVNTKMKQQRNTGKQQNHERILLYLYITSLPPL